MALLSLASQFGNNAVVCVRSFLAFGFENKKTAVEQGTVSYRSACILVLSTRGSVTAGVRVSARIT